MLKKLLSVLVAVTVAAVLNVTAFADSCTYVRVSGQINYDAAFEALELLNRERTNAGLEPLVMSQSLMECAVTRAFEACLHFDHTRPDGSDCTTVQDISTWYGENLYAGSSKAADAISSLMSSSEHRANILHTEFKSVGIACINGTWVQQFSGNTAYPAYKPSNTYDSRDIRTLTSNLRVASPYYDSTSAIKVGETLTLQSPILYSGGMRAACIDSSNYSISISDTSKASINGMELTALSAGNITVTYTLNGTSLSASAAFIIESSTKSIADCDFELPVRTFEYNGKPHIPDVYVFDSGIRLTNGVDYTVEYVNNVNCGWGTAIVHGKGKYSDNIDCLFEITRRSISGIGLDRTEYVYDGKEHKPVLVEGVAGTDYNIRWQDNISAGTALAIVEAYSDNYIGHAELPFTIKPTSINGMNVKLSSAEYTYSGKACKPKVSIGNLVKDVDFRVSYLNNANIGIASVRIEGIGNYTGEITKSFKIKSAPEEQRTSSQEASLPKETTIYIYEKAPVVKLEYSSVTVTEKCGFHTPKVISVTLSDGTILPTDAYDVSYSDNCCAGTGKVRIECKLESGYFGAAYATFTIMPKCIKETKVTLSANEYYYDGTEHRPTVSVDSFYDTDYTCKYSNNIKAGTASVTVTGKNDLTGSVTLTYKITEIDDGDSHIILSTGNNAADGNEDSQNDDTTARSYIKNETTDQLAQGSASAQPDADNSNTTSVPGKSLGHTAKDETHAQSVPKKSQKITAVNVRSYLGDKPFSLNASAKTKLTYKTSNKNVAIISSKGIVTPKGVGTCKITITAVETTSYKSAKKVVSITVGPKKSEISNITLKGGKVAVRWKADKSASDYIVAYKKSGDSNYTLLNVDGSTTKKVLSGLKKGTYSVKVRSYKTVNGKKYYSKWSSVKKVTVK